MIGIVGTTLVVVAYHIDLSTARTAITTIGVVNDAVAEIDILSLQSVFPLVLRIEFIGGIATPIITGTIETR